jgi:hypothetical protein
MAKYKKCQYSVLYRQYTHRIIILQKLLYEEPFTTVRPQLYFNFDLEKNGVLLIYSSFLCKYFGPIFFYLIYSA